MNCKKCLSPVPASARFCPNCGQALTSEATPFQGSPGAFDPDRYMPPELVAKLKASHAGGSIQGERRIITMLFCDVKGSTAAAEQLDPEEWAEIMNGAFEHMIRPVYKYEGLVPRLMGDAILAFFGAPIAHEDDPQRAVLAGLEIQQDIEPYIEETRRRYGISFALRVGINTGLVVVGGVGSDLRMEYTAIGDAINLAARMEQTATPGSVQISEETYQLVAPFFHVEPLGGIEIKGKAAAVKAYRVLSPRQIPGRQRGIQGLSSPLVGRRAELSALEGHVSALQGGQGTVVVVVGEAGLGKSSLAGALHHKLDPGQVSWLETYALSYTQSIGYFSWQQVIRSSLGAEADDPPDAVRKKLREAGERYALPPGDLPFLEAILAVETQASQKQISAIQGDALLQGISSATRHYLGAAAREKPLCITFDDLHWMDSASLTLLAATVDLVEEAPILFLCLTRPEQGTDAWDFLLRVWQDLPARSHRIDLSAFSVETTYTLLVNLLGKREVPETLYEQIARKAEGNPFFIEEIIRSLIETGQIVPENGRWRETAGVTEIAVPKTLSGVLSARIDHLNEGAKQILHLASVLGRSFDLHALSALAGLEDGLEIHIRGLEQAGLVHKTAGSARVEYAFRHVLTREAAYNSILLKRRRELHARVGEYLEASYAERLTEYAPLLAHHFYAARDGRSLQYDTLAGEKAARLYANGEAATHFSRALEVARRGGVESQQVAYLYQQLGAALELSGRHAEALETYSAMQAYGEESGERSIVMTALMAKATIYSTFTPLHDAERSEQTLIQALEISREIGDRDIQTRLHWNLMLNYLFSKRLDLSLHYGELALALARESGNREYLAFVLNDFCRLFTCRGEFEKAHQAIREARELWIALDNQVMLADSFGSQAEAYFNSGDLPRALESSRQGFAISEEIENLWGQSYNRMLMAFAYVESGQLGPGIRAAEQSVRWGDEAGLIASNSMRSELAWAYAYCGAFEKGFDLIEQAVRRAQANMPAWIAFPLAGKVRMHLIHGDLSSAEQAAGEAPLQPISIPYARYTIFVCLANIELAFAQGDYNRALALSDALLEEATPLVRIDIPEVLRWKGRTLAALGKPGEAHRVLSEARALAETSDSNLHLWLILAGLADLNTARGNFREAGENLRQARAIVEALADSLTGVGLRESFLAQARVQKIVLSG